MRLLACALALATIAAAAPTATLAAKSAAPALAAAPKANSAKKALRQYTGWVTALDKSSITVEKRGKKPESKVFVRHADTSVTGELAKDVRVTVYWRDEGGRAMAQKVVVKPATQAARSR
jgi:hypothetical protein